MPFGKKGSYKSAKKLGYLNSQQALADYAVLIRSLKRNLSAEASPVVVFGGSYGGSEYQNYSSGRCLLWWLWFLGILHIESHLFTLCPELTPQYLESVGCTNLSFLRKTSLHSGISSSTTVLHSPWIPALLLTYNPNIPGNPSILRNVKWLGLGPFDVVLFR